VVQGVQGVILSYGYTPEISEDEIIKIIFNTIIFVIVFS